MIGLCLVHPAHSEVGTAYSGIRAEGEVGRIVAERVAERLLVAETGKVLKVAFRLSPELRGDEAVVEVKSGSATVTGSRKRALLFGAGVLLRQMRWNDGTFELADGSCRFAPHGELRMAYWARHFHNWYQMADAAELRRYLEDLALWGVNALYTQFLASINFNDDFEKDPKAVLFMDNYAEVARLAKDLDLDVYSGAVFGNQGYRNTPAAIRAAKNRTDEHWRPDGGVNICPYKPGAAEYVVRQGRKVLRELERRGLKWDGFGFWPYDEGGCGCTNCAPWGGNGYVKLIASAMPHLRKHNPDLKVMVSTWYFGPSDWMSFYAWLGRRADVDYVLADECHLFGEYPRYPIEHPLPNGVKLVTFPEISMRGRYPWGGTGANPYPDYLAKMFAQHEGKAVGFRYYSEGIYEDLNKAVVSMLYVDPRRPYEETLREYARYEIGLRETEKFVRFVKLLEKNLFIEKATPADAEAAYALARELDAELAPAFRTRWRWRVFYLRALIDREWKRPGGGEHTPFNDAAYRELVRLYYAGESPETYRDDPLHEMVRPRAPAVE